MYTSIIDSFPIIQAVKSKVRNFSTFLHILASAGYAPWDNRGKCHTVLKRIQYLSNALQHVPIYPQPFLRYSELLVENCDIFTPHLCLVVGISRIS